MNELLVTSLLIVALFALLGSGVWICLLYTSDAADE